MALFDLPIEALATEVLKICQRHGLTVATAESCTGGLIAAALTEIPGSSAVVDRGFVTYSNAAKTSLLGVDPALFETVGAVSEEVARAMTVGALAQSPAHLVAAVTGVAGPGGSERKPEGLVHFAVALRGAETLAFQESFGPIGRTQVRLRAVARALSALRDLATLSR